MTNTPRDNQFTHSLLDGRGSWGGRRVEPSGWWSEVTVRVGFGVAMRCRIPMSCGHRRGRGGVVGRPAAVVAVRTTVVARWHGSVGSGQHWMAVRSVTGNGGEEGRESRQCHLVGERRDYMAVATHGGGGGSGLGGSLGRRVTA
jgi:hypothetical protein